MPQLNLPYLGFCAIVIVIYWLIPSRWKGHFLAAGSSAFLAYLDLLSFAVLSGLILLVYNYAKHPQSKYFYALSLIAPLFVFCGIRILQLLHRTGYPVRVIVLLGFGFYALKLIHYVVESRSRSLRAHRFLDFYNYMLFFPTILIGPIHLFDSFLKSERRMHWNDHAIAAGLERILYGYAKVIVLANWLTAGRLDALASNLPSGALLVLADSMVYGFYLYFAFSGYSDIAIGLALLLGFEINENFHYPFLKRNIGEFWQSWHMSLSAWCRKYVFLPVYAQWRTLSIALIGSMLAIALWHEFSVRFFLWGIYHGTGLLIWRTYQKFADPRLPKPQKSIWRHASRSVSVLLTFVFVMVGFTIPRSNSFKEIIRNFQILLQIGD